MVLSKNLHQVYWVEIKVYDESGNVISNGKSVSYNATGPHYGGAATSPNAVTDGNTTSANYFRLAGSNDSYVEIDLGSEYIISKVEVWHYYGDGRTYNDQKTQLLTSDKKTNSARYIQVLKMVHMLRQVVVRQ